MPPIAICIPVRNERRTLPGLFAALAAQTGPAFAVAIVFDGCTDDSAAIGAARAKAHGMTLHATTLDRLATPHAGRARAAALALGRSIVDEAGLLLITDADTRPATDWVAASAAALTNADIVCGHIRRRRSPADGWREPIERYLDRLHAVHRAVDPVAGDAVPSHWHQGGASLGMTAAAWDALAAADWPASGEDRAMVRHARLAGLVVRQDPSVRVRTSSRTQGRAEGGLADALRLGRREASNGRVPMMEHPDDVIARVRRSAIARAAHPCGDPAALAERIAVSIPDIETARAAATSADAFATMLPLTIDPHRAVTLDEASVLLARHETHADGCAA